MNTKLQLLGTELALELYCQDLVGSKTFTKSKLERFRRLLDAHSNAVVEHAAKPRKSYHHERHCQRVNLDALPPSGPYSPLPSSYFTNPKVRAMPATLKEMLIAWVDSDGRLH